MRDPSCETPSRTHPGRVFRFCPRCGAGGLSLGTDRCFRCSVCGFEYFINAAAAVVALIEDPGGRLLMTQRAREPKKGTLDLPGGFVDVGETAEQALAREVKEELDLDVTGSSYFGSFPNTYPYSGVTYFTLDLAFVCRVADLSVLRAGDDAQEALFMPPARIILADIGLDSIRAIAARYLSPRLRA